MDVKKIIEIPSIPEDLRLACFSGTDAQIEKAEQMYAFNEHLISKIFNNILSGKFQIVWWDKRILRKSNAGIPDGVTICRRILHKSTRHNGLQLSTIHIVNGKQIPIMHADFPTWDKNKWTEEIGFNGGELINVA